MDQHPRRFKKYFTRNKPEKTKISLVGNTLMNKLEKESSLTPSAPPPEKSVFSKKAKVVSELQIQTDSTNQDEKIQTGKSLLKGKKNEIPKKNPPPVAAVAFCPGEIKLVSIASQTSNTENDVNIQTSSSIPKLISKEKIEEILKSFNYNSDLSQNAQKSPISNSLSLKSKIPESAKLIFGKENLFPQKSTMVQNSIISKAGYLNEDFAGKLKDEMRKVLFRRNLVKVARNMEKYITNCTICNEVLSSPMVLKCGHIYCNNCLRTWFDKKRSCPGCRLKVSNLPNVCSDLDKSIELISPYIKNIRVSREKCNNEKAVRELLIPLNKRKSLGNNNNVPDLVAAAAALEKQNSATDWNRFKQGSSGVKRDTIHKSYLTKEFQSRPEFVKEIFLEALISDFERRKRVNDENCLNYDDENEIEEDEDAETLWIGFRVKNFIAKYHEKYQRGNLLSHLKTKFSNGVQSVQTLFQSEAVNWISENAFTILLMMTIFLLITITESFLSGFGPEAVWMFDSFIDFFSVVGLTTTIFILCYEETIFGE